MPSLLLRDGLAHACSMPRGWWGQCALPRPPGLEDSGGAGRLGSAFQRSGGQGSTCYRAPHLPCAPGAKPGLRHHTDEVASNGRSWPGSSDDAGPPQRPRGHRAGGLAGGPGARVQARGGAGRGGARPGGPGRAEPFLAQIREQVPLRQRRVAGPARTEPSPEPCGFTVLPPLPSGGPLWAVPCRAPPAGRTLPRGHVAPWLSTDPAPSGDGVQVVV